MKKHYIIFLSIILGLVSFNLISQKNNKKDSNTYYQSKHKITKKMFDKAIRPQLDKYYLLKKRYKYKNNQEFINHLSAKDMQKLVKNIDINYHTQTIRINTILGKYIFKIDKNISRAVDKYFFVSKKQEN